MKGELVPNIRGLAGSDEGSARKVRCEREANCTGGFKLASK